jgi:hypothetical protein
LGAVLIGIADSPGNALVLSRDSDALVVSNDYRHEYQRKHHSQAASPK